MRHATTLLVALLALTPFAHVTAQQSSPLEPGARMRVLEAQSAAAWQASGTGWLSATIAAASLDTTHAADRLWIKPQQGRKSPTAAGFLSGTCLLLPVLPCGLGSFYAGNAGHGWRHLGIGLGTWGVVFAGYVSGNCNLVCEPEGVGAVVFLVGLIGYYANAFWGISVAVDDADAHNRRLQRPGGAFAPRRRGEKRPALAALLNWFAFPGVGSFYAGNPGHGWRHVSIGVGTSAGAIVLLATCDSDGFCDFDHDALRLSVTIGLGAGYVANFVWSIIASVSDAEGYNLQLGQGASLEFAPAVTSLGAERLGIRVGRVVF